ncbi:hypothetical protein [Streptomyces finlayi]|uniref:hypothetical protein n=1 Tax=Streptomyces finlayi TaxID=67296 RepID=UPI0021560D33|nr:hypothetical protein [Streptomyces finlayi]
MDDVPHLGGLSAHPGQARPAVGDFNTTMSYYKGRSHKLSLELYYKGTWYDVGTGYFALSTTGRTSITLTGPHDTGYKMRVRSSYVNGHSGDSVNSTTHGSWKYFIFTT